MEEGWDAELYGVVLPGDQETINSVNRKLPCSLSGLVSREMQQWVVFCGTSESVNLGQDT